MLYSADSESSPTTHPGGWKRGLRVGSVKDGKVIYFHFRSRNEPDRRQCGGGVRVDKNGHIYGAEVGPKRVKRYVRE